MPEAILRASGREAETPRAILLSWPPEMGAVVMESLFDLGWRVSALGTSERDLELGKAETEL